MPAGVGICNLGGGGGGGGCFIAGTRVNTPHGFVPIEHLRLGDQVWSYNSATHQTVLGTVTDQFVTVDHPFGILILEDGTQLGVNELHRFFIPALGEWIAVRDLTPGMFVLHGLDANARSVRIVSIELSVDKTTVYNMRVEPWHNYYVEGVLVHNLKNGEIIAY
jgi:hypothetical protein